MVEIEIDGRKLQAEEGSMIIQTADEAGIYIPRFCYHKKLSIAANCRMCLVEVEGSKKPLPACATPVAANMKVYTQSKEALHSQKAVMEFLLINHPLDCPICDQGGECELQDLAMGYGKGVSRFTLGKRSVKDKNLGPLISSDMTRCIQCTRCIRFGDEVAGLSELGAVNRGEYMEVGTYIQHSMVSEVSGNVIDLCPVGALTSKPYRFRGRSWEMEQHVAVAPHDCIGSNLYVHTRNQEYSTKLDVRRVVPRDNESINENWISDRDRYSYEALSSSDRLTDPLLNEGGKWRKADWPTVLKAVANKLHRIAKQDASEIAALVSPNSTLEECYLLQKLLRGLGSNNIDHRIRQLDFRYQQQAPAYPSMDMKVEYLEQLDTLLLIGSNVRCEQPIAALRLRKAAIRGANIMCVNPFDYAFNFPVSDKCIVNTGVITTVLAGIAKALAKGAKMEPQLQQLLAEVKPSQDETVIAKKLAAGKRVAVLLGAHALNHPHAFVIRTLAEFIAAHCHAKFGCLTDGANAAGAWLAGAVPHRGAAANAVAKPGYNAKSMFENQRKAYVLLGVEPELDCASAGVALTALEKAKLVVSLSPFASDAIKKYADFILPIAPFTETPGTFINAAGDWQSFKAITQPLGEVRPAWKVLRVLANLLKLDGFDYVSCEQVYAELKALINSMPGSIDHPASYPTSLESKGEKAIMRVSDWPMYRVDNFVRHSQPLQDAMDKNIGFIYLNEMLANQLQVKDGQTLAIEQNDCRVSLPVAISARVPDNQVYFASGIAKTVGFGEAIGPINIVRSKDCD